MKSAAITLAAFVVASTAVAAPARPEPLSDVDFIQASRCAGLAAALQAPDAAALGALVKAQQGNRISYVLEQGQEAFASGGRIRPDRKARAEAELAGRCAAYRAASAQVQMQAQAPGSKGVTTR